MAKYANRLFLGGLLPLLLLASGVRAEGVPVASLGREQRVADLRYLVDAIRTRHPDPYNYSTRAQWDAREKELENGIGRLDASGYFFRLQEAAALVDDIHTSLFPLAEQGLLTTTLPIRLCRFDGGIYVRAARRDHAALLGARIVAIEGRPIDEVMDAVIRLAPGNLRRRHSNVPLAYLLTPETYRYLGMLERGDRVRIAFAERDGKREVVDLKPEAVALMAAYDAGSVVGWGKPEGWVALADPASVSTPVFYRRRGETAVWFEPLPAKETLLVQVNQPKPDAANSVIAALARLYEHLSANRYRRIVIDLRGNEGGWFSLTAALPGMIASVEAGQDPPRVFVLIGPDTTSAGVVLATQLEQQTDAVFVGEPTGSSPNLYATYKPAPLPNSGIYYRISTKRLILSAPEDDRLWIAPDVYVAEKIDDVLNDVDGALQAALALPAAADTAEPAPPYERWKRASQRSALPTMPKDKGANDAASR
jgi:hypothetical protein